MSHAPAGIPFYKNALAETPREALNWRLLYAVICFGLMVRLSSDFFPAMLVQELIEGYRVLPEDWMRA